MDETIQFHLLGMEDLSVGVQFKKELYPIIAAFHNNQAVVPDGSKAIPG